MRPTLWAEVKRVFGDALDVEPERREAFVRDHAADERVRAEALRLLRRRDRLTRFLEWPTETRIAIAASNSESVGFDGDDGLRTAAAGSPSPGGPPRPTRGAIIVGRYELGERLGAGAFGAVHRARDTLGRTDVAVKILRLVGDADMKAMRREIAILRMMRLPGLVELLDDGIEHGHAFLVMRLVDGEPFPGSLPATTSGSVRWQDLAPRALALVDALDRLHWMGVLHRDLKPDNVLVDAGGAVTIVDFGVARDLQGFVESESGYLVGTPAYLAPERLGGAAATIASDLYSIGAMLYESLGGRAPHDFDDFDSLVRRRLDPVPPLTTVAPEVPRHVAETVDALLHTDTSKRPRSARLVAALLRGENEQGARTKLPFVGREAEVLAVIDAVKAKRPLDLAGSIGCGRTRVLMEADRRLTDQGYRVLWCRPGTKPFESVLPVVGSLSEEPDLTLEEVRAWTCRCLRLWLDARICIVADDWDRLDPHSREALDSVRPRGPLVRVFDESRRADAVGLRPLTELDLRGFFHGPDRLFHLREDGARELFRRTDGHAGECAREVEAWIEGGIARIERGRILIDRDGIDRLLGHAALASISPAFDAGRSLSSAAQEVHAVLETARFELAPLAICGVLEMAPWQVEAALRELAQCGHVREHNGAFRCVRAGSLAGRSRDTIDLTRLHAKLADHAPPHCEDRFFHLVAGDRAQEAINDRVEIARGHLQAGRLGRAFASIREGLAVWRRGTRDDLTYAALMLTLFDVAVASGTPDALRTLLAELDRDADCSGRLTGIPQLARAAYEAVAGSARNAIESSRRWTDSIDTEVCRRAFTVLTHATRAANDSAAERAAVLSAIKWLRRTRSHRAATHFREWLGWLRYRQGRFASAARLHAAVARRHQFQFARVSALLNAASSALELGRNDEAIATADRALAHAIELRLPLLEARAEWIQRSARLRRGVVLNVDEELLDAAQHGLPGSLAALILLNESAVALRNGQARLAARLAAAGRSLIKPAERPDLHGLLDGVRISSGEPVSPDVVDEVLRAADVLGPSRLADQLNALAAPRAPWRRRLTVAPRHDPSIHGEVLSPADVVARIQGTQS